MTTIARIRFLMGILCLCACLLVWRLYDIQVLQGPRLAAAAHTQQTATTSIPALRGSILDRNGNILAQSEPAQSIIIDPLDARHLTETIDRLTQIIGPLSTTTTTLVHDPHTQFAYLDRKVSYGIAQRVAALNLPGVRVLNEQTGAREYPMHTLAGTILGYVGTDDQGLDGLEYTYDDVLRGTTGREQIQYDALGREIPVTGETDIQAPHDGLSLQLTIDAPLEAIVSDTLAAQIHRFHASDGIAIVMNPQTGEILAMVNLPTFDPNSWENVPAYTQIDRAVLDAYEPGSTFKLVTAAAALESGKVTMQSRFPAHDELNVGGWTIHNAEDGFMPNVDGTETLEEIVGYSHNVGAAEVAMATGVAPFYAMERAAGFGEPTDVGLAGESAGLVPNPATWSASSLATMAFGQGVAVTPLQLTTYYCAIANGGLLMHPLLVRAELRSDGTTARTFAPTVVRRVFPRDIAKTLQTILRFVVTHGTGDPTADNTQYPTAGKTGTAQIVNRGRYLANAYSASFIGMVPYPTPRYVIYVRIDHPQGAYYGSIVAAPVFTAIVNAVMAEQP